MRELVPSGLYFLFEIERLFDESWSDAERKEGRMDGKPPRGLSESIRVQYRLETSKSSSTWLWDSLPSPPDILSSLYVGTEKSNGLIGLGLEFHQISEEKMQG